MIYWANSMFAAADRAFNSACAAALRSAGFDVFLPQETTINEGKAPTSSEIFRSDTAAITKCNALVACIDQETIDAGVACEIGIAFGLGIPVLGLYTDVRRNRMGEGRMYKNLYILGAIEERGEIVGSLPTLIRALSTYTRPQSAPAHFSGVAGQYDSFLNDLESWYSPRWQVTDVLRPLLSERRPKRILEFGSGTGRLASWISREHTSAQYVGFDGAPGMVASARSNVRSPQAFFSGEWNDVTLRGPYEVAILAFSLHDNDAKKVLERIYSALAPDGYCLVLDLTDGDLPALTESLRQALLSPIGARDPRVSFLNIGDALEIGFQLVSMTPITLSVSFPSSAAVLKYLEVFGIDQGFDLPLGIRGRDASRVHLELAAALESQVYPLRDLRVFASLVLRRPSHD